MTDTALRERLLAPDLHTNKDAVRRLKIRYAAEARFRAVGLVAILLACVFLVFFLSTIIRQGFPAFFHHYLLVDVELKRDDIDPRGTADPAVLGQANYDAFVRNAVRAFFPGATDRAERRAIDNIVSSGAPVILRRDVVANPQWVGSTQQVRVPLDDTADLYLKGFVTSREVIRGRGEVGVSGIRGTVQLSSTVNNFQPILAEVKAELGRLRDVARADLAGRDRQIARQQEIIAGLARDIPVAAAAERQRLEGQIDQERRGLEAVRTEADTLRSRIAEFERRIAAADAREQLEPSLSSYLVRINGGVVKLSSVTSANATGTVLLPLRSEGVASDGDWQIVRLVTPESSRRIGDREIAYLDSLVERGVVVQGISREFFTGGASREPELAGIAVAVVGSIITLAITLLVCFPIGVSAAIYLEEFAPKNWFTEMIEVNINNLAAVPSIIFGLLGLAVFLNTFDMPRSAPVVGGLVLALMTLPIIIIASRAAVRAVPPSVKEAALGVGASQQQAVFQHVLPLAMPGILTGTILGMAHALGETAPLLMIGMVAFVVDFPKSIADAATLLPVQIFMWADFPEPAFQQKTAAAIMMLLAFLVAMNGLAIYLRKKFERRW